MKLLPTACALFMLSAPLAPRLAAEDDDAKAAAAAVNPQDVDAIIAAIPRRDEALKPKLAFYDRMRQEYEAKTKDAGAAKTAGAAAISAFARAFATDPDNKSAFEEGMLAQLTAAEKAGAKDPLLGLLRILRFHLAGDLQLRHSAHYQAHGVKTITQEVIKEYGDESLSSFMARLIPTHLASYSISANYSKESEVIQEFSCTLDAPSLITGLKNMLKQFPEGEESIGELWLWAFHGYTPRIYMDWGKIQSPIGNQELITAFEQADWRKEFGDRPLAHWLSSLQAYKRAWDARGRHWDYPLSEAGKATFVEEMRKALDCLPADDHSTVASLLRNACGCPAGHLDFGAGLREATPHLWSPSFAQALTKASLAQGPYLGGNFSDRAAQLRLYMEAAVRQQRWDVCGKLLEAFDLCALNDRTPNKPAAVKNLLATDHEWIGDWCASVSRALSAAPDSDPQILSRIYTLQVICTEDPKSFRALLLEDAPRKKSLLNAELLNQWIGPDWKAQLAFRSACGHPLIGTELAAVGPDDPRSLTELRNFARQFRYMAKDADDEPLAKAYLVQRRWRYTQSLALLEGKSIDIHPDETGWISAGDFDADGFLHPRQGKPAFINLASLPLEEGVVIEADLKVTPGAAPTRFGVRDQKPGTDYEGLSGLGIKNNELSLDYFSPKYSVKNKFCSVHGNEIHQIRLSVKRESFTLHINGILINADDWRIQQEMALQLGAFPPWDEGGQAGQDATLYRDRPGHGIGHVRIHPLTTPSPLPVPLDLATLQHYEKESPSDLKLLVDAINLHLTQLPANPLPFEALSPDLQRRLSASQIYNSPFSTWIETQIKPQPCVALPRPSGKLAWTAQADSEENPSCQASNVVDGNYGTLWCSKWIHESGFHPHPVTVDLQQPQILAGVRISRRDDGSPNGTPGSVFMQISVDGKTWTAQRYIRPVQWQWKNGYKNAPRDLDIFFAAPAAARYLRIDCSGELACLAEIVPLAPAPKAPPVPATLP